MSSLSLESHSERLQEFLRQNWHGEMAWMKEKVEWRSDPSSLWPKAKSCIMLGESYSPNHDPLEILEKKRKAQSLCMRKIEIIMMY